MKRMTVCLAVVLLFAIRMASANPADAYAQLKAKDYGRAVSSFLVSIQQDPENAHLRKDLAYTYLKIGETPLARDQFAAAMKLDPADRTAALEFAYLAFETGQRQAARRVFLAWKDRDDAAKSTFLSIDETLAAGIRRWTEVVAQSPNNWTAHYDLAKLAEERDELDLAASHYLYAWRLRQDMRELLIDFGRTAQVVGRKREAIAALLAASRGPENYTAERASALLPQRYPYLYEFEEAMSLDPKNLGLQREHAYFLLALGRREDAVQAFKKLMNQFPEDELSQAQLGMLELRHGDSDAGLKLLQRVMESRDSAIRDRVLPVVLPELARRDRAMGERSLQAGYLKDAVRFLTAAYEKDPRDHQVMLKLGWAHNLLKQDDHAIEWFRLAAKSAVGSIAKEAKLAYRNLNQKRWQTTVWMFPMFSSRWSSGFGYAQAKTEWKSRKSWIRPYVSLRVAGDSRGNIGTVNQAFLSESSLIFAGGVASKSWKGLVTWAESGVALNYLPGRRDIARWMPDHRGGAAFSKGWGSQLGGETSGWFFDTTDDAVFISRFDNNTLFVSQNRAGWTFQRFQPFWATHFTLDAKRQSWANFAELGPGLRVRLPRGAHVTASWLTGKFLKEPVAPFGHRYQDLRIGLWYAFTR
jgi:Flp pilus assembly protein TadD